MPDERIYEYRAFHADPSIKHPSFPKPRLPRPCNAPGGRAYGPPPPSSPHCNTPGLYIEGLWAGSVALRSLGAQEFFGKGSGGRPFFQKGFPPRQLNPNPAVEEPSDRERPGMRLLSVPKGRHENSPGWQSWETLVHPSVQSRKGRLKLKHGTEYDQRCIRNWRADSIVPDGTDLHGGVSCPRTGRPRLFSCRPFGTGQGRRARNDSAPTAARNRASVPCPKLMPWRIEEQDISTPPTRRPGTTHGLAARRVQPRVLRHTPRRRVRSLRQGVHAIPGQSRDPRKRSQPRPGAVSQSAVTRKQGTGPSPLEHSLRVVHPSFPFTSYPSRPSCYPVKENFC